jgi:hypothetical protein
MGGGASKQMAPAQGNDFSMLRVHARGINITEAYDSDVDDEFDYDAAHYETNDAFGDAIEERRDSTVCCLPAGPPSLPADWAATNGAPTCQLRTRSRRCR